MRTGDGTMTDSAKIIELLDKIGDKIIEEKEFLTMDNCKSSDRA